MEQALKKLGKRIAEIRNKKNMTQKKLYFIKYNFF